MISLIRSDGGRPLIITHNGASGVYPGSTDLAYQQAVKDGADIIDCAVRMSKDGVAFCQPSADLSTSTTASTSFMTKISTVSEIQNKSGIFSFDLTWSEIQTLKRNNEHLKSSFSCVISSKMITYSFTKHLALLFCLSDQFRQPIFLVRTPRQA